MRQVLTFRALPRHRTLFITERSLRHQQAALRDAPPELDVVMLREPARDALPAHLAEAEFLISEPAGVIDTEMLAAAPRLKMILRLGSLSHDIDLAAAQAHGITVVTWPQPGVIYVRRTLRPADAGVGQAAARGGGGSPWPGMIGGRVAARMRTLSRITGHSARAWAGCGSRRSVSWGLARSARKLARRLRGWGCHVLYYRRRRLPAAVEAELGIAYATWDELLAASNFVVNLLPYFPETDLALNAAAFAQMRRGACLVSCGSGSVIDERALAEAVVSGHLAGVALDTFEWEPLPPDNPLRRLAVEDPRANVLLTPHIAAGAARAGERTSRRHDYEPILRYLQSMSDR